MGQQQLERQRTTAIHLAFGDALPFAQAHRMKHQQTRAARLTTEQKKSSFELRGQ